MKVVIDIPENDYKLACNHPDTLIACYAHYIKAGVQLPKKYGRLIDADALIKSFNTMEQTQIIKLIKSLIDLQPTVIEAEDGDEHDT